MIEEGKKLQAEPTKEPTPSPTETKEGDGQPSAPKVSFRLNFQKRQEVKHTTGQFENGITEDSEEAERQNGQKRGVVYLEDGQIIGEEPPSKKGKSTYVIPMPTQLNDWRIERLKKIIAEGNATDEDRARLALLIEAFAMENQPNGAKAEGNFTINPAAPDEDFMKQEGDIDADYEQVPISEFGLAFLRGCGWREEEGIGKTNKRVVKLEVTKPRPVRLGLGAKLEKDPNDDSSAMKPGSIVWILSGTDRFRLGVVKSVDGNNGSCYVEVNGRVVLVSQHQLELREENGKNGQNKPTSRREETRQYYERDRRREERKNGTERHTSRR